VMIADETQRCERGDVVEWGNVDAQVVWC